MRRIAQDRLREINNVRGQCRREKQRLAFHRQHRDDAFDIAQKSHVEHPVHLIEHKKIHLGKIHMSLINQIEQTSGRRHQHINSAAHGIDLWHLADTTVDEGLAEAYVFSVGCEALTDLDCQLASGCQHQRAATPRAIPAGARVQRIEDRQSKSSSFTSAGLRATQQIATL